MDTSDLPRFNHPFSLLDLIAVLQEVERRYPLAEVGRSREGTGNLCVYDGDDYVGVILLSAPPSVAWLAWSEE